MWSREGGRRLLAVLAAIGSGCGGGGGIPETVEPLAYYQEAFYSFLYYESGAPVSASPQGTLVTWWNHLDETGFYDGYAVFTFDVVAGDHLGGSRLYPPVPSSPVEGPPVMSAVASDGYILSAADGWLEASDPVGNPWWRAALGGLATSSVAIGEGDVTYVGDSNGLFYAFSAAGDPLWVTRLGHVPFGHPAIRDDGSIWVAARTTSSEWHLLGLSADGALLQDVEVGIVVASLAIDADGHLLVPVYLGGIEDSPPDASLYQIVAIDPEEGVVWEAPTDGAPYSPVVGKDGTVYVAAQAPGEAGHLLALKGGNGKERWRTDLEGDVWQPAILDNGTLVVGCGAALCGYDLDSGREVFAWPSSPSVTGVFGPPLAHDGIIVATTSYGFYAWEIGGGVQTEPEGWSRLGADNGMTGRAP